jgi:hypothetical protein
MASAKSSWWIEQRLPTGNVRLRHYGPYADRYTTEQKIKQLRFTARYRKADLIASEENIASSKAHETPLDGKP